MKNIERVLHIIWKLIFQKRVIRKPIKNERFKAEYTIINSDCDDCIEITRDIRKQRKITTKSLGLSSLLVTFKSDVIPSNLNDTIVMIGITKENMKRNIFCFRDTWELSNTESTAENISESVTTRDINFAKIFLNFLFFIVIVIKSIPDTKKITERISEVSKVKKYSLSILKVFIKRRIME